MKYTLLELVQNILSAMESDTVTSITDTPESEEIAETLRDTYFQMVTNTIIPEHYSLCQFDSAASGSETVITIPDNVAKILWFKYNKTIDGDDADHWSPVRYLCPEEFLNTLLSRDSTQDTIAPITEPKSGISLNIENDQAPSFWTSFDDKNIIFDSYDMVVDTLGIDGSKTLAWARIIPTWTVDDAFTPDLDDNLFPYLLAEAKSTCFINIKQISNAKIEQQARNQKVKIQSDRFRSKEPEEARTHTTGPDYGRR